MNVVTLTIPTGASADHHCILLNDLERHVLARPEALDLRIGGENTLPASIAASYCALIARHVSERGEAFTSAVSSLEGAAAILWLHGSVRRINPGAYVLFNASHRPRAAELDFALSRVGNVPGASSVNPEAACYARLLTRAKPYLDLEDVLGEPLFEDRLRSLLLIGPVAAVDRTPKRNPSSNLRGPVDRFYPDSPGSHLLP